mmetsp:Transcript_52769/g.107657  ORF Transcript_52769/g.107657 Transcript_52769/m.107657 type:complete len:126 (-) Transcript_52769:145-522(-)
MVRIRVTSVLALCFLVVVVMAHGASGAPKKGPRSNADRELRTRRSECERDVCTGLQNEVKLTCTYRCISPECYEEVYSKDEIEEGEVDTERGRLFSACFRRMHKKDKDAALEKARKEKAERRAAA